MSYETDKPSLVRLLEENTVAIGIILELLQRKGIVTDAEFEELRPLCRLALDEATAKFMEGK